MPQALRCANSSHLLRETLTRALPKRKSLVDEVFPTCVYTVALGEGETLFAFERQVLQHTVRVRQRHGFGLVELRSQRLRLQLYQTLREHSTALRTLREGLRQRNDILYLISPSYLIDKTQSLKSWFTLSGTSSWGQ
ncbi:hypothetical protein [Nostoc sp.]|uniref:hypothetical protein n=1 Tax=Nostoc sp. TaxID=1180 RepID=UPI002FFD14BA